MPLALAAGGATGLLYALSTGTGTLVDLAWIAPAPVLAAAFHLSDRRATILAAVLGWSLGQTGFVSAYHRALPASALIAAVLGPALVFASVVRALQSAERRMPWPVTLLVFPCFWTAWEFLLATASADGAFFAVGYSQSDRPGVMQLASVTGVWGVTWLLCLTGAAAGMAVARRDRARGALTMAAVPVVVALMFGAGRLMADRTGDPLAIGLAADDASIRAYRTDSADTALAVVQRHVAMVRDLGARGARLIVLPEKFVTLRSGWRQASVRALARAARQARALVVAGFDEAPDTAGAPRRNTAWVFAADGAVKGVYLKRHFVRGLEDGYAPGAADLLAGNGLGVAICKDMDFPALARSYGRAGVGLMLVPAWDFGADGRLHARIAVMRGVESGFALARSAADGRLTVTDDRGRLVAEASSAVDHPVTLRADVRPGAGRTFYAVHGDWFGWADVAVSLLLIAGLAFGGRFRTRAVRFAGR